MHRQAELWKQFSAKRFATVPGTTPGTSTDDPSEHPIRNQIPERVELPSPKRKPSVGVRPDVGFAGILYDRSSHKLAIPANKIPQNMHLEMLGRVVRVPTSKSLPLCEVFGHHFFLDGSTVDKVDGDRFLPAWAVPEAGLQTVNQTQGGRIVSRQQASTYMYTKQTGRQTVQVGNSETEAFLAQASSK